MLATYIPCMRNSNLKIKIAGCLVAQNYTANTLDFFEIWHKTCQRWSTRREWSFSSQSRAFRPMDQERPRNNPSLLQRSSCRINTIVERRRLGIIANTAVFFSRLAVRHVPRVKRQRFDPRNSILITWINVYTTNLVVIGFHMSICSKLRFLVNYCKDRRLW